jgi:hypothetical protein
MSDMSWREARQALMDSDHGANDAQQILDDLAHFPDSTFGYRAPDGVKKMRYAGLDGDNQPRYTADLYQAGRPPAVRNRLRAVTFLRRMSGT